MTDPVSQLGEVQVNSKSSMDLENAKNVEYDCESVDSKDFVTVERKYKVKPRKNKRKKGKDYVNGKSQLPVKPKMKESMAESSASPPPKSPNEAEVLSVTYVDAPPPQKPAWCGSKGIF